MSFSSVLKEHGVTLKRSTITTLQINIGKRCNQSCFHCHVESSPSRTENMELATVQKLITLLENSPHIDTIDITGGAPELNPHFRTLVAAVRKMGKKVIDRCNLTILFEPNQEDTAQFLADNEIQVVASLPCYMEDNVDKQRGKGVFGKSIEALQILNSLGYGKTEGLGLDLVYNPVGFSLPPEQYGLERDYKKYLKSEFDIVFNSLLTITNMPIKRYKYMLKKQNKLDEYMSLLQDSFNPVAANNVMCKSLVSIGYDGQIYDCDFNQMLEMPLGNKITSIFDIGSFEELSTEIATASHCFGCTAGFGSSCGGAITQEETVSEEA